MDTKSSPAVAGDLAAAKRSFDEWRRNRKGREPIPDALWRMAAEAASIHGVSSTARRLGLNSTTLKNRVQTLAQDRASEDAPRFLELPWSGVAPVPECTLEAEDRAGRTLRIHLKGEATAQAVALSRVLWRGEE
jgi:transposase-like protein